MTQIGYARVSKADGSQVHDLQRDALIAAGVDPEHIYEDSASGRLDKRPGLDACLKALRRDDTLVIWGSVAKIVKLEHAWRRLDGRNDDGFQVAPFPG